MLIDWTGGRTFSRVCPVCAGTAPKLARLSIESILHDGRRLNLVQCPECGCAFYDDLTPARYETYLGNGALKFYVEQGAGIDVMLGPLFRVPRSRVRNYLEVGCGFGYSLDFARFAFDWRACGVDPSAMAAAGRDALKLDIVQDYLTEQTDLPAAFDLVLCSEVIEHVPDPHRFLKLVQRHLVEDGALLVTTPNVAAIRPETPSGLLLSILAPGHHLVLFSKVSLEQALRANGFAHVEILETPYALQAVAARNTYPVDTETTVDRRLYRRYLVERAATIPVQTPVGLGFAYRLFKECVNSGDLSAAQPIFEQLRAAYAAGYEIDLSAPDTIVPLPTGVPDFERFAAAYPFNLTGVLYFRGVIEMNDRGDYDAALLYFRAAATAGVAVRTALRAIGADDGETENLVALARVHSVYCLARHDPAGALAEMHALASAPGPDDPPAELWQVPPDILSTARDQLLLRLVNAGWLAAAVQLIGAPQDPPLEPPRATRRRHIHAILGEPRSLGRAGMRVMGGAIRRLAARILGSA